MPGELITKGQQKKTQALNFKFNLRKPLAESNVKIVRFLTAFFWQQCQQQQRLMSKRKREDDVRDCYLKKEAGKRDTLGLRDYVNFAHFWILCDTTGYESP